jgi:putative ABC transport system substrate-binding protein
MRRRDVITLVGSAATAWPVFVRAQQPPRIYRVGYLAQARIPDLIEALRAGLRELGYVEGRNLTVDYQFGGNPETLDRLAAKLVASSPHAIVTVGTPPVIAAKRATTTIPIVMALIGDPVHSGIVTSLSRPGGNITGVTVHISELSSKRVEVFKEAVNVITHLAVLANAANPTHQFSWKEAEPAARQMGIEPQLFTVRDPDELATAFAAIHRSGADGIIILSDAMFNSVARQINMLALQYRVPMMSSWRGFVEDGGLISYGPKLAEITRRSAAFVDKLLKGARPADLPIEEPTEFELVINLKTAKALGLTIPPSLLARADEVIE